MPVRWGDMDALGHVNNAMYFRYAESGRIATGFLGTPLVLPALTRTGHLDEAYAMLLRREAPSCQLPEVIHIVTSVEPHAASRAPV